MKHRVLLLVLGCSVDPTGLLPLEDAGLRDAPPPDDVVLDVSSRECSPGASQPCRSIGACQSRQQECVDGSWGECIDTTNGGMDEVCDMGNVDEDCDGMSNEGCACVGDMPCGVSNTEPCTMGVQRCLDGVLSEVCEGAVLPQDEICNGINDDCDMETDEGLRTTFFTDDDGDGVGTTPTMELCELPLDGYASVDGDCDDGDPARFPGNLEVCDDKDNDCDEPVDEGLAVMPYYPDGDGDGYGSTDDVVMDCADPGENYLTRGGDCMDMNSAISPDADEECDLVDNNCSDTPDDGEVCRSGCIAHAYAGHVYQFCDEDGTFWESRDRCDDMGGSDAGQYVLVTIDDAEENAELNTTGQALAPGTVWWIGLTDSGSDNEGNYRWLSGTAFSYANWDPATSEPNDDTASGNEDCGEMRPNGRWNDERCNTVRSYICEQAE